MARVLERINFFKSRMLEQPGRGQDIIFVRVRVQCTAGQGSIWLGQHLGPDWAATRTGLGKSLRLHCQFQDVENLQKILGAHHYPRQKDLGAQNHCSFQLLTWTR